VSFAVAGTASVGAKSGLLNFGWHRVFGSQPWSGQPPSLVRHLKNNPDSQGKFTIKLGNYAKRNTR
jgi:hypothetical protein